MYNYIYIHMCNYIYMYPTDAIGIHWDFRANADLMGTIWRFFVASFGR